MGRLLLALGIGVVGYAALGGYGSDDKEYKGLIVTPTGEWTWAIDKVPDGQGWRATAVNTSEGTTYSTTDALPGTVLTQAEAFNNLASQLETSVDYLKDSMRSPKRLEDGLVMTDERGGVAWEIVADPRYPEGERVLWQASWVTSGQGDTEVANQTGFGGKAEARTALAEFLGVPESKVGGK